MADADKKIFSIVLTGGSCSGKTKSLERIPGELQKHGFAVFVNPESATELMSDGVKPPPGGLSMYDFEREILKHQIAKERSCYEKALRAPQAQCVIIHDRGRADVAGYLTPSEYLRLLAEMNIPFVGNRDEPYDAVVHLRTTAFGAEQFYTCETNLHRQPRTLAEERALDDQTLRSWIGHSHLAVIDNSTDFEGKFERVMQAIYRVTGIPAPVEIERKFLLDAVDLEQFPVPFETIDIEQVYLRDDGSGFQRRIRRRGQYGYFVHYLTRKRDIRAMVRSELEEQISKGMYNRAYVYEYDRARVPIKKKRHCFVWHEQYFELDVFEGPHRGLTLLEIELPSEDTPVKLPPFLSAIREVTEEPEFANSEIARMK